MISCTNGIISNVLIHDLKFNVSSCRECIKINFSPKMIVEKLMSGKFKFLRYSNENIILLQFEDIELSIDVASSTVEYVSKTEVSRRMKFAVFLKQYNLSPKVEMDELINEFKILSEYKKIGNEYECN